MDTKVSDLSPETVPINRFVTAIPKVRIPAPRQPYPHKFGSQVAIAGNMMMAASRIRLIAM